MTQHLGLGTNIKLLGLASLLALTSACNGTATKVPTTTSPNDAPYFNEGINKGAMEIADIASKMSFYCNTGDPAMGPAPNYASVELPDTWLELTGEYQDPAYLKVAEEVNRFSTDAGMPRTEIPDLIKYKRGFQAGNIDSTRGIVEVTSPECATEYNAYGKSGDLYTHMYGCEFSIADETANKQLESLVEKSSGTFVFWEGFNDNPGRFCALGKLLVSTTDNDVQALRIWYALDKMAAMEVELRDHSGTALVSLYDNEGGITSTTLDDWDTGKEINYAQQVREILGLPEWNSP